MELSTCPAHGLKKQHFHQANKLESALPEKIQYLSSPWSEKDRRCMFRYCCNAFEAICQLRMQLPEGGKGQRRQQQHGKDGFDAGYVHFPRQRAVSSAFFGYSYRKKCDPYS